MRGAAAIAAAAPADAVRLGASSKSAVTTVSAVILPPRWRKVPRSRGQRGGVVSPGICSLCARSISRYGFYRETWACDRRVARGIVGVRR